MAMTYCLDTLNCFQIGAMLKDFQNGLERRIKPRYVTHAFAIAIATSLSRSEMKWATLAATVKNSLSPPGHILFTLYSFDTRQLMNYIHLLRKFITSVLSA